MKKDPIYRNICERFKENPKDFEEAFAKAWFKLLHRDMGPRTNYVAGDFKDVEYIWQDPTPKGEIIPKDKEIKIRSTISKSDISINKMVETAWASASTFRASDNRGGANGARIRLNPQKEWEVNQPDQLKRILKI